MYYFAADTHFGLAVGPGRQERERLFVRWLDEAAADAEGIFLVGDIFDFWFEYRNVVPKGHVRLLGKLAELTDRGIPIHFFAGNHDMWLGDYLHTECGLTIHTGPYEIFTLYGKEVLVGHGDVLGPRPLGGRLMSAVFRAGWARWLFRLFHPRIGVGFGQAWSRSNRGAKPICRPFRGEGEPIVQFARGMLKERHIDLFISGHNHCAEYYSLGDGSAIAFLGEWIENPTYGVLGPDGFALKKYPQNQS